MANNKALKQEIALENGQAISLKTLVKEYKAGNNTSFDGSNLVITAKNGRTYSINVANMSTSDYRAFFSTDLANIDGVFQFFKDNNGYFDEDSLFRNLYGEPLNSDLFSTYYDYNPSNFAEQIKEKPENTASLVSGLNVEQANNLLTELKKENDDTVNTAQVWGELPDSVKYNPTLFEGEIAKSGAPLVSSLPKYEKYADKAKLIKLLTNPKTDFNKVVEAFGIRSVYSDSKLITDLMGALKAKAQQAKPKEYDSILDKLRMVKNQSEKYLSEVKDLQKLKVVPSSIKDATFKKFMKEGSVKSEAYSKFQLSQLEKEFVKEQVLKFDMYQFVKGDAKAMATQMTEWTKALAGQKYKGQKMNINLDKMFLDRGFMKEIFKETVPAAAMYRYYYGQNKDGKKGSKNSFMSVKEIMDAANNFSGALYKEHQNYMRKVTPITEINAVEKLAEVQEKHKGTEISFADAAKLKDKQKIRVLKDIENGKYAGEKGSQKMDKLFEKYGEKISTDKEFVQDILLGLEDKAISDSFAGKKAKTDVKENVKESVNQYKPVFHKVVTNYSEHLDKMDKVSEQISEIQGVLETMPYYEQQVVKTQEQEKDQDAGMTLTK